MTDKEQSDALRLAALLDADEWPGSMTLVSYARECVAELLRQHGELETLRTGYTAARLEVGSLKARLHAAKQINAAQADSVPAVSDLPPLPAPDLRDVGTKPQEIKEFLKGYATEYARTAIAARAPADSVQEGANCAWSNDELTAIYNEANGITVKNPPITTERIFAAMRRVAQIAARAAQKEGEKT